MLFTLPAAGASCVTVQKTTKTVSVSGTERTVEIPLVHGVADSSALQRLNVMLREFAETEAIRSIISVQRGDPNDGGVGFETARSDGIVSLVFRAPSEGGVRESGYTFSARSGQRLRLYELFRDPEAGRRMLERLAAREKEERAFHCALTQDYYLTGQAIVLLDNDGAERAEIPLSALSGMLSEELFPAGK